MFGLSVRIIVAIACLSLCQGRKLNSRFTNLECLSFDETFSKFTKCKLKLIRRGVVGADIYLKLLKVPVNQCAINWSMLRRYNGYRPFLFNQTADLCKLLKNTKTMSFAQLVLNAIKSGSNLNHTCPYNHDIIMDNFVFSDDFLRKLPMPQGDYKMELRFSVKDVWKLQVNAYLWHDEILTIN